MDVRIHTCRLKINLRNDIFRLLIFAFFKKKTLSICTGFLGSTRGTVLIRTRTYTENCQLAIRRTGVLFYTHENALPKIALDVPKQRICMDDLKQNFMEFKSLKKVSKCSVERWGAYILVMTLDANIWHKFCVSQCSIPKITSTAIEMEPQCPLN